MHQKGDVIEICYNKGDEIIGMLGYFVDIDDKDIWLSEYSDGVCATGYSLYFVKEIRNLSGS